MKILYQLLWLKNMGINYYLDNNFGHLESSAENEFMQNIDKQNKSHNINSSKQDENSQTKQIKYDQNKYSNNQEPMQNVYLAARHMADNANSLQELKEMVMNFDLCDLKKLATNTVFADGSQSAKIMCIGEAPGATEDKMGIPFCGESGQLLDNMFAAIGLSRSKNLYITNTVFWRPPANREPTKEEIDMCKPFLEKHIALINPSLIILIGSTAVKAVLNTNLGISRIRSEYYSYTNVYLKDREIKLTAIFHPAYLLRQPSQKQAAWHDLLKIKQLMNL